MASKKFSKRSTPPTANRGGGVIVTTPHTKSAPKPILSNIKQCKSDAQYAREYVHVPHPYIKIDTKETLINSKQDSAVDSFLEKYYR